LKKILLFLFCCVILIIVTACSTTTITDKPGDHKYGLNEKISVIDIDTRKELATVKFTGYSIIRNTPFELTEADGTDESGKAVYKKVKYSQLVQIYYVYSVTDSSKKISSANFYVQDSFGESGNMDPKLEYDEKQKEDQESFVVALKGKGSYIDIDFNYNLLQTTPTARIRIKTA
jgi:hypothetical protein